MTCPHPRPLSRKERGGPRCDGLGRRRGSYWRSLPPAASSRLACGATTSRLFPRGRACADELGLHAAYGIASEARGDMAAAEQEYRTALTIEQRDFQRPVDSQGAHGLGADRVQARQHTAGDRALSCGIGGTPRRCFRAQSFGRSYARLGRTAEAEEQWQTAIKCDPDLASAEDNLGHLYTLRKQWPDAIEHLHRAIELDPDIARCHLDLGVCLFATRRSTTPSRSASRRSSWTRKARRQHRPGGDLPGGKQAARGVRRVQGSLHAEPRNPEAAKGLGIFLSKTGHGTDAAGFLRQALAARPGDLQARRCLVLALLQGRQTSDAMAEFRAVLRQDPNDQFVLQQLGQLVAAMPKDVFLRGFAANALLAAKQPAIAVAQFREVLKLDPNNADALNSLAWIEATHADAKLRNGKEAVVFAEKAAGLKKDDAPTLDTLAAAYAEAGRFKEAVATRKRRSNWPKRPSSAN